MLFPEIKDARIFQQRHLFELTLQWTVSGLAEFLRIPRKIKGCLNA
jgi:hypothetical protein